MTPHKYGFGLLLLWIFACAWGPLAHGADLYDENADAHRDVASAVAKAQASNRNIVLIFGANWCPDCHALDAQMKKPELAAIIEKNFVIVEVDTGRGDKNLDLAEHYHVPVNRGIPALAVLDSRGKLLYAMDQGQFADARRMSYESIRGFFAKWKPSH
jgi:protein disulfide-isomerase